MEEINNKDNITDDKYVFKLDCFEGPLDLLLYLIKDAKLDITTIKLSDISEQYLTYMQQLDILDMERASEFIEVATILIEIKSNKLLPKIDDDPPGGDDDNPEQKLLLQIKEYEIFKTASEKLKSIEELNRLYKAPDKNSGKVRLVVKDMQLENLITAFSNILARNSNIKEESNVKQINRDRFTVEDKIAAIKDTILIKDKFNFTELIAEDQTKSEIINIFLALLELLKLQVVKAFQKDNFSDIEIRKNIEETNGNN